MPEVETIEGYLLKVEIKFEVDRLNRIRDFMSTRLKKIVEFQYNFRQLQLSKEACYTYFILIGHSCLVKRAFCNFEMMISHRLISVD